MAESALNPPIRDEFSPLDQLIDQALRRMGEYAPGTVSASMKLMFLDFANMVVEEVRTHPYHEGEAIPYYTALTEARPIPDTIMLNGLVFHYKTHAGDANAPLAGSFFYRSLNGILYERTYGNTPIEVRPRDR